VTTRKKKILGIQIIIFLFASTLLYNTYTDKEVLENENKEIIKIESKSDPDTNTFEDVEYTGLDLNGNRYSIRAERADFKVKFPEMINMSGMVGFFYFKDNTVLKVIGDNGYYNNKTYDMEFRENVRADYLTNYLLSDKLVYSNTDGKLTISGNVRGESIQGDVFADNVEYDLNEKILDLSMLDEKQVNVKIREK
tara:strand:- start:470 stop:1054 length:585 start_codon:yes stop_codon:yes gene_type:complete